MLFRKDEDAVVLPPGNLKIFVFTPNLSSKNFSCFKTSLINELALAYNPPHIA